MRQSHAFEHFIQAPRIESAGDSPISQVSVNDYFAPHPPRLVERRQGEKDIYEALKPKRHALRTVPTPLVDERDQQTATGLRRGRTG
jgi:hypothetical protein